ncbi:spore coat protein GerQ [Anoxybacillus rupiensis]|jgi:spore germination protein Q|uniref:Spore coat protein GerQ n=1 Tax=Anoxybacteroides rupiense TaxID=311460 RepID=A0ABD5IXB6_9BACL|nr:MULTISPECIES: spore coat protein GerQ [Anoxybacillus]KXG08566.1 Spore coat protein GerQ [Anoxybacillus sp. P3H1B]MBB3908250.1 spore germination protein Q [Anoxybacillus rupiensis]MBS2771399.1 spore coat protein GerQ [Anoxybacillus rupiensis]MDE8563934.1 spore coat protein GerQ [Anoxybacillus rupiensis]MED5052294.1 spore coat protein GerQ [Anoxybacillus rupiensis]
MTYEEDRQQSQGYASYPYGYAYPQGYYPTTYPYSQQAVPYQPAAAPMAGFGMQTPSFAAQTPTTASQPVAGMLPLEESYIENILRLNKGKMATVYMTFENNREWNAKVFRGTIEAAGRDHLILSDPQNGKRYLLPMIYLNYVTFDEEIAYEYPYAGSAAGLSSYSPR